MIHCLFSYRSQELYSACASRVESRALARLHTGRVSAVLIFSHFLLPLRLVRHLRFLSEVLIFSHLLLPLRHLRPFASAQMAEWQPNAEPRGSPLQCWKRYLPSGESPDRMQSVCAIGSDLQRLPAPRRGVCARPYGCKPTRIDTLFGARHAAGRTRTSAQERVRMCALLCVCV